MQLAVLVTIGLLALRIAAGKVSVVWLNVCVRPEPGSPDVASAELAEPEEANPFGCETSVRERVAALGKNLLVAHRHDANDAGSAVPPLYSLQPLVVQVQKQALTVGNRIVGNMWVDGGGIRGEGGPSHPQLVLPLTIEMTTAPEDAMMATVWVRGRLSTESTVHRLVTQPVSEMLVDGFPARSLPAGAMEHRVELRFFLTPPELEALETQRHANTADLFELYVAVDAVVAALQAHNELKPGEQPPATPWNRAFGTFLQVLPFWSTRIMPMPVRIEPSKWTRDVLPGLGYDRSRLLEISFPPPLPDHRSAASEWDGARRAFDERRYGDCVAECRDLLSMWRKELGAATDNPVSAVIAKRRGWSSTDARIAFVDGVWKSAVDIVNAPHHPEGQEDSQHFDAADARLILLLTAALSAYLRD